MSERGQTQGKAASLAESKEQGLRGIAGPGASDAEEEVLIAPENFSMVVPGVYRSGFPKKKNFAFVRKLELRSILTLVLEEYPDANKQFNKVHGVQLLQFGVPGNKEPFVDINEAKIRQALEHLLDTRNHPVLVHCNKGKHRTGCLIGCLRRACGWSLSATLDEYIRFSAPKSRFMDQQFIELFSVNRVRVKRRHMPKWIATVSEVAAPGAFLPLRESSSQPSQQGKSEPERRRKSEQTPSLRPGAAVSRPPSKENSRASPINQANAASDRAEQDAIAK